MKELIPHLNRISSYLSYGFDAHRKTANELRGLPKRRGYARMHEGEAEEDALIRLELDKLFKDNLGFSPTVDHVYIAKAGDIIVTDLKSFQDHFTVWIERENSFVKTITDAINLSRDTDIEVYNRLCKLSAEVKNESKRAKWMYEGLEYVGWQPHHIAVESKWLHDYFEFTWKPGMPIDYNVG